MIRFLFQCNVKKILLFLLLIFQIVSCIAQEHVVLQDVHWRIDHGKQIVLCNQSTAVLNILYPNNKTTIFLDELYAFSTEVAALNIGAAYSINKLATGTHYKLYFTDVPIVTIQVLDSIVNEPNVPAYFTMVEPNGVVTQTHTGIKYRGYSSQNYPKKSMSLSFWMDAAGVEKRNISLLGMINDDDWNLQAMYNEPIRLRSKSGYDLWRLINQLHYQHLEPQAINGVRMAYVELFINGAYQGVYCVGEKSKRKQYQLKKHNGLIRGELYKAFAAGANDFTACPPYNNNQNTWSGFEYKYPTVETNWYNIHAFVDFVVNADSTAFYNNYESYFDMQNAVDYFIFLNLLRLKDNITKNNFIAKYTTNTKYFYMPWDLDGSLGINWNMVPDLETEDILTNGFFNRLVLDCRENGFRERLESKWLELRSGVVTVENLMSLFSENHDMLLANGIYEREMLAWPEFTYDDLSLDNIQNWLILRLAHLDKQFVGHCKPLNLQALTDSQILTIYPNPTNDMLHLQYDPFDPIRKLEVVNLTGQTIKTIQGSVQSIDLQELTTGSYLLLVSFKDRIIHVKFQKN